MSKFLLIILMVFSATSANAAIGASSSKTVEKQIVDVGSPFEEQKKSIEIDLADGETYSELSGKDRDLVKAALQRISSALASAGSVDALLDGKKPRCSTTRSWSTTS